MSLSFFADQCVPLEMAEALRRLAPELRDVLQAMVLDGMSAAATANARILLRMLSSRGKGRYLARARGVDFTTSVTALSGVIGVGALEGIV